MFRSVILLSIACCAAASADVEPASEIDSIGFGSCLKQERDVPIFEAINAVAPDVFVFLGDNVYGDTEDMNVLRSKYAKLGAMDGFKNLTRQSRVLATWDDHDLGRNDAGVEYPKKAESKVAMLDFFGEPDGTARRQRDGVHEAYTFGPAGRRVQLILLDTRWFRSALTLDESEKPRARYKPSTNPADTLLGEEQWQWLEMQFEQPADLRVVASSIQVYSRQHKFEKWANFPVDTARLDRLVEQNDSSVVFISGDRHFAEIMKRGDDESTAWEVTSSSLNSSGKGNVNEPNDHRVPDTATGENNLGMIRIDWPARKVSLQLQGESGQTLSQAGLNLKSK
jgi:alkaline phosphatase D